MPDYSEEQIRKLREDYTSSAITRMRVSFFKNEKLSDLFKSACSYDLELAQWVFNTFKLSREHVWGRCYTNGAALYRACELNQLDTVKWIITNLRELPLNKNEIYRNWIKYFVIWSTIVIPLWLPIFAYSCVDARIIITIVAVYYIMTIFLFWIMCESALRDFTNRYADYNIQNRINYALIPALRTKNVELMEYMANLYQKQGLFGRDNNLFEDEMDSLLLYNEYDAIIFLLTRFNVDENTIRKLLFGMYGSISTTTLKHIFSSCPSLSKYEDEAIIHNCNKGNDEAVMCLIDRCAGNEDKKMTAGRAVRKSCKRGNFKLANYIVAKFGLTEDDCISDRVKDVFGPLGPKCAAKLS
jgi:hypothetical protein